MVARQGDTAIIKQRLKGYTYMHKLSCAVSLLAFVVILVSGLKAQAGLMTIVFRTSVAVFIIGVISRVVIQILHAYEEIHSG